jgi:hypothetical protein
LHSRINGVLRRRLSDRAEDVFHEACLNGGLSAAQLAACLAAACRYTNHGCSNMREEPMALRKFIIEREIPAVGSLEREQLRGAAAKSNAVLHQLGPDIQWVESYVAADKTFCVYLAKDEAFPRARSPKCAR